MKAFEDVVSRDNRAQTQLGFENHPNKHSRIFKQIQSQETLNSQVHHQRRPSTAVYTEKRSQKIPITDIRTIDTTKYMKTNIRDLLDKDKHVTCISC